MPFTPGPVGPCEVSAISSILREGKHQAFARRFWWRWTQGCVMSYLYLAPKGDALLSLRQHPHKFSKKRNYRRNAEDFFFPLQPREYVSLQEGDLGRLYKPTVNSKQAIAHSLKDGFCLHNSLYFIDSWWILFFGLWKNSVKVVEEVLISV